MVEIHYITKWKNYSSKTTTKTNLKKKLNVRNEEIFLRMKLCVEEVYVAVKIKKKRKNGSDFKWSAFVMSTNATETCRRHRRREEIKHRNEQTGEMNNKINNIWNRIYEDIVNIVNSPLLYEIHCWFDAKFVYIYSIFIFISISSFSFNSDCISFFFVLWSFLILWCL